MTTSMMVGTYHKRRHVIKRTRQLPDLIEAFNRIQPCTAQELQAEAKVDMSTRSISRHLSGTIKAVVVSRSRNVTTWGLRA
jgi:hypothetical protein